MKLNTLDTSHRIMTPVRQRYKRFASIPTAKPYPRDSFDVIQEGRCVRNDSVENHIVSKFPNMSYHQTKNIYIYVMLLPTKSNV
jgi:hypothetical protein